MSKRPDTQALLAALRGPQEDDDIQSQLQAPTPARSAVPEPSEIAATSTEQAATESYAKVPPRMTKPSSRMKIKAPRSELKHFGGYLDDDSMEKVALLRIRLKLENSDLIKLAIEDLYKKHNAKRAFGDV